MRSALVFAMLVVVAALFGSRFMPGPWYEALAKPEWTPPNWLFGPVWTLLYIMIAMAGWLVWQKLGETRLPVMLWAAQLVLNALWSLLFFGLQRPGLAFAEILLLLATIVAFIVAAWRSRRAASLLFVPYALWVGFASLLNLAIWRLNV